MVRIAIFGDNSDIGNMISLGLCSLLKEHLFIGRHRCCSIGENPQYLIFETEQTKDFATMRPHIVIFGQNAAGEVKDSFIKGDNLFAIVESENFEIAKRLIGSKIIVCGISAKDTVTVSSIDDNEIVVSIQRAITDIYGNLIEPQEANIITTVKAGMEYETLAAITALIICGFSPDMLKKIWT